MGIRGANRKDNGGWPVLSETSTPEGALPFSRFVREGGDFDPLAPVFPADEITLSAPNATCPILDSRCLPVEGGDFASQMATTKPRSGERMQPAAQAAGSTADTNKPRRGERKVHAPLAGSRGIPPRTQPLKKFSTAHAEKCFRFVTYNLDHNNEKRKLDAC